MIMNIVIDGIEGIWTPTSAPVETLPEGYVSEHFRESEFDCNHCGKYGDLISCQLLGVLEDVRAHFGGKAVTINSGVRCDTHNANVGGASQSRHKTGYADAADIVVKDIPPWLVADYLEARYPVKYGVGRYSSFTHIDTRPNGPARWS